MSGTRVPLTFPERFFFFLDWFLVLFEFWILGGFFLGFCDFCFVCGVVRFVLFCLFNSMKDKWENGDL